MTIEACAALVQRADPDRFMAAMAAPVEVRKTLFPIYAMNVEVARAPWVTDEPMIAQIRLQWWRDALAEIGAEGVERRHEVVTPLAGVVGPDQAVILDEVITARYWDIYHDPFEDAAHFNRHIDQTSGSLMWVAAQSLGLAVEAVVRDFAYASGLSYWLRAVPALQAQGRRPLLDDTPEAIQNLAKGGLERLARARDRRTDVSRAASAALLVGWQAETVLKQALHEPGRVAAGTLGQGEIGRRASLMRRVVTGRW